MAEGFDAALITTKIEPPTVPAGFVVRGRLVDRLDAAVDAAHRLVLVSAAAGSGKSTLLGGWVDARDIPAAWLQVESHDADPARFWTYLVAAIGRAAPGVERAVAPLVAASGGDEGIVVGALVNELAALTDGMVVVIDDYHLIDDADVHRGVERLVELAPEHVTFVIATRIDPPFRLGRLRIRRQMSELRVTDLRFDADEAAGLLAARALDRPLLEGLCERTEGWAAGLVFAAMSLDSVDDVGEFVESFRGDDQLIVEYLTDELLSSLDSDDRRRLLETAILDRMTGPLVDALTGASDGDDWLACIATTNQLVIGLDRTGTWFRYHHLLRDLLRLQLERAHPERVPQLHLAAGAWHLGRGHLEEAVEHHLAGGDHRTAADLIADNANKLINGGRIRTVLRRLDELGDLCEHHVGAAVVRGWTSLAVGRLASARRWQEIAADLDDGADAGMIACLGVMIRLFEGDVAGAWAIADTAPTPTQSTEAYAMTVLCTWSGRFDEARANAAAAVERAAAEPSEFVAASITAYQAVIDAEVGLMETAGEHARRGIADVAVRGTGEPPALGLSHALLARLETDPERARIEAGHGVDLARRSPDLSTTVYTLALAGDALCTVGDEGGRTLLSEARTLVGRCPDPGVVGTHLARVEARHGVAAAPPESAGLVEPLTERELAVLRFLPTSMSQRDIASELFVSLNTVKSHSRAIYRKLGVGDRKAAVQAARDHDLL